MKQIALILTAAALVATVAPAAAAGPRARPAMSTIVPLEVDGAVRVTISTTGRPLSVVMVCDLDAVTCTPATRDSRYRWSATLGAGARRIGAIGRSGADYVFESGLVRPDEASSTGAK